MKSFLSVMLCVLLNAGAPLLAQSAGQEAQGSGDVNRPSATTPDPGARARALGMQANVGLLLIPESTNDRVMAFDPATGDLIDANFIPADPNNLSTPICAIPGFSAGSVLVSDQLEDVVVEYDINGAFVRVFAPAGGADTSILDNVRGIARGPNDTLLVTTAGGANANAIAQFDSSGNFLGNFVAPGAGGLDSPFDVFNFGDYLVGGINSDIIHAYDNTGAPLADFAPIDSFPEQIAGTTSGNVLVANFTGSQEGIVEFASNGALVGVYNPAAIGGYRGAWELANGNILTTNGGGVHEIDRNGNLVETKISGVSARFIEFSGPMGEVPTLQQWGMILFIGLMAISGVFFLRRRRLA